jgi:hypothetical protein
MRYKLEEKKVGTYELPKGKQEHIMFDSEQPGLALCIRSGGSRKCVVHYRFGRVCPSSDLIGHQAG